MKCKNILIVEDNSDIRETIEDVLKMEGYIAYAVSNGREALQAMKHIDGPSLILLDMMMPLMNGWEFMEAQKQNAKFANLPVIVISALSAETALRDGDSLVKAQGFIRKPLDLETLLNVVKVYCDAPSDALAHYALTTNLNNDLSASDNQINAV